MTTTSGKQNHSSANAKINHAEKATNPQTKSNRVIRKIIILFIILALVLILLWLLLRGKTTVSGQFPENARNESLTCISSDYVPPKLNSIDSDDKELKVNMVFKDDTELRTISLIYLLTFETSAQSYAAEAKSHAEFNKSLSALGYSVEKFANKFTHLDNQLKITLSAQANDIDSFSAPFFILAEKDDALSGESDLMTYQQYFTSLGFICKNSLNSTPANT